MMTYNTLSVFLLLFIYYCKNDYLKIDFIIFNFITFVLNNIVEQLKCYCNPAKHSFYFAYSPTCVKNYKGYINITNIRIRVIGYDLKINLLGI